MHDISEDEGFNPTPTCITIANGDFENPAIWNVKRVPSALDWVQIDHIVTFSSNISVWTIYISPTGSLVNEAVGLIITISDIAPEDVPQFDTGIIVDGALGLTGTSKTSWARAQPLSAGATSLTVDANNNWKVGDKLVIGDTREVLESKEYLPEVRTLSAITNHEIKISEPLTHDYPGARDHNGLVERLIPVGNLTRDITIKSANPKGHRGHIIIAGRASANLRYINITDMGRTTLDPLDPITNHIGRYALHLHHLDKFNAATIIGCVVEKSTRWGITVHASSGNTLKDNVCYDTPGWGFGTEDSTEEDNTFENNLSIFAHGTGGDYNELVRGTGFWMAGPRNILIGNVAMNATIEGFALYDKSSVRGILTLNTFRDNESIANYSGLTTWGLGSNTEESILEHLMEWNNNTYGLYTYAANHLTFHNFFSRSDPDKMGHRLRGTYNFFGDYDTIAVIFTNPNVQNKDVGFYLPYGTTSPQSGIGERITQFIDGYYYNLKDFFFMTQALSSASAQPMRFDIISPIHGNASGIHYEKSYHGDGDLVQKYQLFVVDYQGLINDNFEVLGLSQEPDFPMPKTAPGIVGCPVAGLTNKECKEVHGVSIYGELMPEDAVTRNNIVGKVSSGGPIPPPPETGTVHIVLPNGDIYEGKIVKVS